MTLKDYASDRWGVFKAALFPSSPSGNERRSVDSLVRLCLSPSMEMTIDQAELFPVFAASPAKRRSKVRQFVDATLQHGPLLTPVLVAEALGVTKQRVNTLLNENRIAHVTIEGERFVPCTAVDLFLTEKGGKRGRPLHFFRRVLNEADRVSDDLVK